MTSLPVALMEAAFWTLFGGALACAVVTEVVELLPPRVALNAARWITISTAAGFILLSTVMP